MVSIQKYVILFFMPDLYPVTGWKWKDQDPHVRLLAATAADCIGYDEGELTPEAYAAAGLVVYPRSTEQELLSEVRDPNFNAPDKANELMVQLGGHPTKLRIFMSRLGRLAGGDDDQMLLAKGVSEAYIRMNASQLYLARPALHVLAAQAMRHNIDFAGFR